MPKIYYPDNFKIEVVKYYKMHRNIGATLEKYGIARSTLFKWKKKYEENHFFRVSKKPANTGHKAQSHLDKLNKIVAASKELKCRQSFSAPGYPYDNSVCESFFNTRKKKRFIITFTILPPILRRCLMNILSIITKSECIGL